MTKKKPMTLNERIKQLRNDKGLSRRALSMLTGSEGVTEQTIYQIEQHGRTPMLPTLERLAAALDTTTAKLIGE